MNRAGERLPVFIDRLTLFTLSLWS